MGEGLYWKTVHWLGKGEHAANTNFNAAVALAKTSKNPLLIANVLEHDVLPFWHEASDRLDAIDLPADSPYLATLESLQNVVDSRMHTSELFDKGLRDINPEEIKKAKEEQKQLEQKMRDRKAIQR